MTTMDEPADGQAIALCWLARQQGLPVIHSLRRAVAQLHDGPCDWCDFPLRELMRMIENRQVSKRAEDAWWALPGKARLRAIEIAAGRRDRPDDVGDQPWRR